MAYCEICGASDACAECDWRRPDLWPGNEDAWSLWVASSTQWRSTGFGIIGLDYPAVKLVSETIGMRFTPGLFAKIRLLEMESLARQVARLEERSDAD
ncbi:DUF1799 domain-containing protein [Pseudodesulfovibrio tunisiensis]|uniref:DUF1799 domain-containing protein n=1 Tax=Pseudodesulfovibrio tunisiensis TaxID=463192 RepID=UPI0024364D2C|nr:DUF1799 domain-containing protein [Pseudodesulfovibrio tunisiensis]